MIGVTIMNIHSNKGTITDTSGEFLIRVEVGELVEITKFGYQTIRLGFLFIHYSLELDIDYFDLHGVDI